MATTVVPIAAYHNWPTYLQIKSTGQRDELPTFKG